MHSNVANCIQYCLVYQWDKLPVPPKEELCWMDQGGTLFIGCSINVVSPLPWDKDRNHYLIVTMDPFSKWLEIHAMPSLYSGRTAEFLYNDLVAH